MAVVVLKKLKQKQQSRLQEMQQKRRLTEKVDSDEMKDDDSDADDEPVDT